MAYLRPLSPSSSSTCPGDLIPCIDPYSTCHLHIGTAHPRPSLARLMRPLCTTPSPLPASAIIPKRHHPCDRPSRQCEPPAHARPHADLCLALAGGARYIRRGPYPDLAIHPPGRRVLTPQNRHLRFRSFIWCCVFACALNPGPGIYVPRPRHGLHPALAS